MEGLANQALTSLRGVGIPVEIKLKQLTELKAEIKHRHCPEVAIGPLFDVIRLSLATPHLTDAGFSILGHLTKRLELQDQSSLLHTQGAKTYSTLLDRLADPKDRIRQRAIQALTDFHAVASTDVEHFVRDNVLTNRNAKAKEAGMQWVAAMRRERNMPFRTFVSPIVDCLEDADGSVRQSAQATIIDLFRNAGFKGTNDLQRHLQQRSVRKSIVDHILSELGLATSHVHEPPSPPESHPREPLKQTRNLTGSAASITSQASIEAMPVSLSEQETVQLDPVHFENIKELEEAFREMHAYFEGKETEQNWLKREKSILKLRKITKGNGPQDFTTTYLACMKGLLDGILKTVNSLRTTVCTIGCHLVQDIARVAGSGLDNMVEILLQNLIKLCASTKKIAAANGNDTVATIMSHVSYNIRLTQHIHNACQDKNVQPRSYACGWLKVIIAKHGHHKSAIEHAGGLELIEKCLKAGLIDRDPSVRESMRPTYWAFARRWPDKSEALMSTLDERNQKALINNPANPNPDQPLISQSATAGTKSAFSKSTTSVPPRPSVKETIAAQKKAAKMAGKNLPPRPESAEPFGSPRKPTSHSTIGRPGTSMSTASRNVSTTSVGTLSSAPVRPRRRADIPRPATADPYASRKVTRTETPPRSPAVSPVKKLKTPAPSANSTKLASRKADSPAATSPVKGNSSMRKTRAPASDRAVDDLQPQISPTKAAEDFTMVVPTVKASRPMNTPPIDRSQPAGPALIPGQPSLDDLFSPNQCERFPGAEENPDFNSVPPDDSRRRMSPTKLASDFGSRSLNGAKNQRISMSPRAIGSRKETRVSKSPHSQEQRQLKVYEDPVRDISSENTYPSPLIRIPRALEELPVNEPAKNRQVFDHQLLAEEPRSLEYHQKWLAVEAAERRRLSASENVENPHMAKKILDGGIDRIQARTLDVHGFRKLQALIRTSGDSIWEGGYKFDELIIPLLEFLEIPTNESAIRLGKAQDLKTQALVTIKLLLQNQPGYFSGYYPRALSAVLTARKHYNSTSHIVCGLEETAESIVHQCDPLPCIDLVMDLLKDQGNNDAETHTVFMALYILAGLLHRKHEKGSSMRLTNHQEIELGRTGARFLADTNPDVRRAVIEFVLELHDTIDHDRFWGLVAGERDDHRSLITYYLARKRAIA